MIHKIHLSGGTCLGRHLEGATCVVDRSAPVHSGDLVEVLTRYQHTGQVVSATKQLEVTRDGRWWITCLEGAVGLGGYYLPAAIFRVVDVIALPFPPPPNPPAEQAVESEKHLEFWDKESRAARFEWTREGKQRGIPFPGIEAALAAGYPPTSWPLSFRLPPNYFPEDAHS